MAAEFSGDLRSVLGACEEALVAGGIPEAKTKARLLIAALLDCGPLDLLMQANRQFDDPRLDAWIDRLCAGEPIQYLLGEVEFMALNLKCDPRALIPRFETEELVEFVQGLNCLTDGQPKHIVDIGTGSGCIALALASFFPQHQVVGVDVSAPALDLARENQEQVGVTNCHFQEGDLLEGWGAQVLDLVVANLPYISAAEVETLDSVVREFEPRSALDGGERGTELIEQLIDQAAVCLRQGGAIVLEIGDRQGDTVASYLEQGGWKAVEIRPDLQGRDRIAVGFLHGKW